MAQTGGQTIAASCSLLFKLASAQIGVASLRRSLKEAKSLMGGSKGN
jgi:hypothetical protein